MKGFDVNTKELEKALKAIDFSSGDLLDIEGAGAKVLVNGMRMRVAKDTHATENSVNSHITKATATVVEDEVGPETDYAPYIEYGHEKKDNYPMQPFVRPTVKLDFNKTINAIGNTFGRLVVSRWPK